MSRCQLESKGLGSLSALHADGSQKTDLVASNGFFREKSSSQWVNENRIAFAFTFCAIYLNYGRRRRISLSVKLGDNSLAIFSIFEHFCSDRRPILTLIHATCTPIVCRGVTHKS